MVISTLCVGKGISKLDDLLSSSHFWGVGEEGEENMKDLHRECARTDR